MSIVFACLQGMASTRCFAALNKPHRYTVRGGSIHPRLLSVTIPITSSVISLVVNLTPLAGVITYNRTFGCFGIDPSQFAYRTQATEHCIYIYFATLGIHLLSIWLFPPKIDSTLSSLRQIIRITKKQEDTVMIRGRITSVSIDRPALSPKAPASRCVVVFSRSFPPTLHKFLFNVCPRNGD